MEEKKTYNEKKKKYEAPKMIAPPHPAFTPEKTTDPPTPNRAWTEMKLGKDIDALTEAEKADLYLGRDGIF